MPRLSAKEIDDIVRRDTGGKFRVARGAARPSPGPADAGGPGAATGEGGAAPSVDADTMRRKFFPDAAAGGAGPAGGADAATPPAHAAGGEDATDEDSDDEIVPLVPVRPTDAMLDEEVGTKTAVVSRKKQKIVGFQG